MVGFNFFFFLGDRCLISVDTSKLEWFGCQLIPNGAKTAFLNPNYHVVLFCFHKYHQDILLSSNHHLDDVMTKSEFVTIGPNTMLFLKDRMREKKLKLNLLFLQLSFTKHKTFLTFLIP